MITVNRVSSLRSAVSTARKEKKTISFVPTMGNLHAGHLELVKVAKSRSDYVIVSIYVNPTQFGAHEDLSAYPNTPDEDAFALAELDVDVLFLPEQEVMYPGEIATQTVVSVPQVSDLYCGEDRPQHFYGVTTVVSRLFNMVAPDIAVFGKKDYQQLAIIRRMVRDLAFPVQIVGVDTVRSESGLALSSRNGYLSESELIQASKLNELLNELAEKLKDAYSRETLNASWIKKAQSKVESQLRNLGFDPHYVQVCDQIELVAPTFSAKKLVQHELVILAAATLGKARLIDNVEVELKPQT
ncbi:MAG: pantoate--beta-alanine ligase [Pseudomonadota bacterium]